MAKRRKQKGQHLARGIDPVYRASMRDIRKAVRQDQLNHTSEEAAAQSANDHE